MAAEAFKGLTVKVTLKDPTFEVQGVFEDVKDGNLTLRDVLVLGTGQRIPRFESKGHNIADLAIAASQPPPLASAITPLQPRPASNTLSQPENRSVKQVTRPTSRPRPQTSFSLLPSSIPPPRKPQPFTDPAILSYNRPSPLSSTRSEHARTPTASVNQAEEPQLQALKVVKNTAQGEEATVADAGKADTTELPATQGIADTQRAEPVEGQPPDQAKDLEGKKKRTRRGRRTRTKKNGANGVNGDEEDGQQSSPEVARSVTAQDGWRNTPIIQDGPQLPSESKPQKIAGLITGPAAQHAIRSSKQKGKSQAKASKRERDNDWATEEATDIQDMGEFDFEGNLSQFDKKAVFEQLRNEDSTADEERLVAYNRKSKYRNLQPTENVLSPTRESAEYTEADVAVKPIRPSMELRVSNRSLSRAKYASSHTTDVTSPASSYGPTLLQYEATGGPCPAFDPYDLAVVEGLAVSEHALSEDILDENAARGIASAALANINAHLRRPSSGKQTSRGLAVIVVGDEKTGARALAAGRHLAERGVKALAILKDWKTGDLTHYTAVRPRVGRQARRFGGRVMGWEEASKYLKTLDTPPDLIIDALIGYSEFASQTDKTALEIAGWANRSRASVVSIDVPSGVHPETGAVDVVDGEFAEVRAKTVVCCGAPLTGLAKAMETRREDPTATPWQVQVCDTGVNRALKKLGRSAPTTAASKRMPAISFGNEWTVSVISSGQRGRQ